MSFLNFDHGETPIRTAAFPPIGRRDADAAQSEPAQ